MWDIETLIGVNRNIVLSVNRIDTPFCENPECPHRFPRLSGYICMTFRRPWSLDRGMYWICSTCAESLTEIIKMRDLL